MQIPRSHLVLRRLLAAIFTVVSLMASSWTAAQQVAEDFKTSYRYNTLGEVTGVIYPDPDGAAGPLPHPARRNTYDGRGHLTLVEHGELAEYQSEEDEPRDWEGFTVHRQEIYTYDALGRQITAGLAGADGVVHAMTQSSYDDENRTECVAQRMNPDVFSSLPTDACAVSALGDFGPDRITRYTYSSEGYGEVTQEERAVGTLLAQVYVSHDYDDVDESKG